jgi:hypothetical protein
MSTNKTLKATLSLYSLDEFIIQRVLIYKEFERIQN